jgi:choline kinase
MKAVILTAGAAPRLRPHTETTPKTLLPVAGVPILRRAISNLVATGFDELVIGTGYRGEMVREAVTSWFPDLAVTYVDNPSYATTYNAFSLLGLREHVDGQPFILLDDDVVFDAAVIDLLLDRGLDSIAVRSVGGIHPDEVKVQADGQDRVVAIGAELPVRPSMGESIGLALFSGDTSRRLFAALARRVGDEGRTGEYYEASIQEVIDDGATMFGVDIGSLYALGIDTWEDLQAASARLASHAAFDPEAAHRVAV